MRTTHSVLTEYLTEHKPTGFTVTWTVPESVNTNSKNNKLIVVEQTGGSVNDYAKDTVFAVDVYADKLKSTEEIAYHIVRLLRQSVDDILPFLSVDIMSVYNNPLLDSKQSRYTITFVLTVDWAYDIE